MKITGEMWNAFENAAKERISFKSFTEGFSAALAAAPTPPAQEGLKVEFTKEWCMKMARLEGDSAIGAGAPEAEHVAVVINNNQPGWENIIETKPYVTLAVGTKLYSHPANDGLRKVAEKALSFMEGLTRFSPEMYPEIQELRDALKTK